MHYLSYLLAIVLTALSVSLYAAPMMSPASESTLTTPVVRTLDKGVLEVRRYTSVRADRGMAITVGDDVINTYHLGKGRWLAPRQTDPDQGNAASWELLRW